MDHPATTMSESEKYRAFRNYMFNELGISKADIQHWVLEAVRDQVSNMALKNRVENLINDELVKSVNKQVRESLGVTYRSRVSPVVERIVTESLKGRVNITIKD